jgi:hypothetical protein
MKHEGFGTRKEFDTIGVFFSGLAFAFLVFAITIYIL